ncbi:MAG: alpha/beta fold hydrolase, partial [Pseudomonadota bacterium]
MRFALSCLGVFALTLCSLWWFGPREPVGLSPVRPFDTPPTDIETWLAEQEVAVSGIREGVAKEIVWADPGTRARTPLAIVYLHGYSATSAETRPFADNLAAALGANLHFTRLTGHGRDGDAMASARVQDWIDDTAEALAVGRAIGDRVVVVGTSTGGTLATLAAADAAFGRIDATVLISPNYRVKAAGSALLTVPFARQLVPLLVGDTREWAP